MLKSNDQWRDRSEICALVTSAVEALQDIKMNDRLLSFDGNIM
jgi:hypothetical protein